MPNLKILFCTKKEVEKKLKDNIQYQTNWAYEAHLAAFEAQKESIWKIVWTQWFKSIQEFWLKQEMDSINEFENVDLENKLEVAEIRAKYKLAKKFNTYLNVRLK